MEEIKQSKTKPKSKDLIHEIKSTFISKKEEKSQKKLALKKEQEKNFAKGKFQRVKLSAGSMKFSNLYSTNSWKRYLIVIIVGVVMGMITLLLLKNTGLYNSGLSAILQGIARLVFVSLKINGMEAGLADTIFNVLFWGLFVICNIPLLIFSYYKIGKTFTKLTLVFVLVNSISGFSFGYIPNINELFLFGNTMVDSVEGGINLAENGVFILTFTPVSSNGLPPLVENPIWIISPTDVIKSTFMFIYAVIYGFAMAFCYGIIYIIGASSAGTDIISIYYATVKQKSLGKMLTIVNSVCLIIGSTMGSYIAAGLINPICFGWQFFLSANLVASFVCVILFGLILNMIFPRHKMIQVEIYSDKHEELRQHLVEVRYTHSTTLIDSIGGYSLAKKKIITTVCMYIELPILIDHVRLIDKECLVIVKPIIDIDGTFSVQKQGSLD